MAWTTTDLDALKSAYARGVRSVTLPSGLRTEYASLSDLRQAIKDIEAELLANSAQSRLSPRYQRAVFGD